MTILKAELLAVVNDELNRTETNIDAAIIEACMDLAERGDFLPATDTITTEAGTYEYDLDSELTRFKSLDELWITGGARPDEISFADFLDNIEDTASPTQGEPEQYALKEKNRKLYLWYVPDGEYTVNVTYYQYHANTADTIAFADRYRKALEQATTAIVARKRGMLAEYQFRWSVYLATVAELTENTDEQPVVVRPFTAYEGT